MSNKIKKIGAALLAVTLCISILAACSTGEPSDVSDATDGGQESGTTTASVGSFTTQDIDGNEYTQDVFRDYDLTLVNIFATWCSPCVGEMPDLEKLRSQVADKNVNVIGVVLDVRDMNGEIDQEELQKAQELQKKTGVKYPILLPDTTYFNGRLAGIEAIPETFFVDRDGNIVGETYSGSGDLAYWLEVVEKELADLEANQ